MIYASFYFFDIATPLHTTSHPLIRRAGGGRGGSGGAGSDENSGVHVDKAIISPVVLAVALTTMVSIEIVCVGQQKKKYPRMKAYGDQVLRVGCLTKACWKEGDLWASILAQDGCSSIAMET